VRFWAWLRRLFRRRPAVAPVRRLDDETQHGVDLMHQSGDTHHLR
jgi:hypothetical protein